MGQTFIADTVNQTLLFPRRFTIGFPRATWPAFF
jgi:hypothetical protein